MAREVSNIAASVRARLQNVARESRANFQRVLTRYALERLLFRLSVSPHKGSFVLKGAMLYAAWLDDPFRTTRDLDLLAFGERDAERLVKIFREVCVQPVEAAILILGSAYAHPSCYQGFPDHSTARFTASSRGLRQNENCCR